MDPLRTLNLDVGCSLDAVKERWRRLSRDTHPDLHPNDPDAAAKFRVVQEAYEAIEADPSILDGTEASNNGYLPYIRLTVPVTIEDFYFARTISVKISRQIFCSQCNGTGSQLQELGLCQHCSGTGQIKSKLLDMIERSPMCPICKGSGISEGNLCTKCTGTKYESDVSVRKVRLSLKHYHKKFITIKDGGHQISKDVFSNAFIKLSIKYDDSVIVEDDHFRVYEKVTPVQKILGDTSRITVFGRELIYKIEKGSSEATITDMTSPGVKSVVRVVFIESPVEPTEDTLPLYRKILAIEKRARHE